MRTRLHEVLTVCGVAAATMAFTLVLLAPWSVGVSDEAPSIKPRVFPPKFVAQGCEFVLKTDKPEYQPGETPIVEIEASNPTDKAVETTVWVSVSAAAVPSEMSRVLSMPRPLWSQPWLVSLQPGEKKTTKLATDTKLPAKQNVTITLGDQKQAVLAESLPVRAEKAPAQAAAQPTMPVAARDDEK